MRPVAENVLIEICFISNSTDMKLYQANKQTIAKKLANDLKTFSKI
jgi:N-acetylmuramoyl-L-alanine amidase